MGDSGQLAGFLAVHRTRSLLQLTERLVATILHDNPAYAAGAVVPREDLHDSCRDNIVRVLELLALRVAGDSAPVTGPYFDAARATGSRRAEQGLPLDDVLRSFRVGGRLIWEDLIAQAGPVGMLDGDDLRIVGTELWHVVDDTSAQVAEAYHSTQRLQVRADEQRRAVIWEALLSGRGTDAAFVLEAARVLGLSPHGTVAVAVVDQPTVDRAATARITRRLAARGVASTWQHRSGSQVGVLELTTSDLGASVEVLGGWGVPVGLSSVVGGLAATGSALGEAMLALRTVAPGSPGVALYQERLPEALLLTSPEVADRLVQLWLGPLLDLPAREGETLLETLECWIAAGGSASRTATLVPCHRNTVVNRIRRVVDLTGHELLEGAPPVELSLALRRWRLDQRD
ncbi:PucR family transcriptional regulator [Nocardioides sp. JQ2195]|uniref:PucR family transcriptional regulator n=1 Tax=Nocardioides sp. JQ2195 TaxID=2592334 RepID=UPI00143E811A|nr:helix-turn-helix domain-containing protein [Nocardioides sp. JQ2195]QIX25437.1 PucR family transcriptional regulator [Nocardioides sp. JQ2195]